VDDGRKQALIEADFHGSPRPENVVWIVVMATIGLAALVALVVLAAR
jgi:hypothetical protein